MHELSRSSIAALLTADGNDPKVTIYIPMHVAATPPHMTENQIRFKNLIHKATEQLRTKQHKKLAALLDAELEKRMTDVHFWEAQTEGLLLCAADDAVQLFHLPLDTEEYVAVDSCYHLAPVLGLLHDEQSFYVLSVSQHQPRLFAGSMYGLCEMQVDLPESLEASLNLDENNQKREQGQAMGHGVDFNGRGGRRDSREEERLRFFRLIDSIVVSATERGTPLILAGTESETAEYRTISKHSQVMHATITGSFAGAKAHELFAAAYAIVHDELVVARRQRAIDYYKQLQGTHIERVATDPIAIAEAAKQGRIDTLLVALRQNTADTVRDTAKVVERITFPRTEINNLINKAATAVANASGRIINIDTGSVVTPSPVLALLRY
jgi:hypothetical protein